MPPGSWKTVLRRLKCVYLYWLIAGFAVEFVCINFAVCLLAVLLLWFMMIPWLMACYVDIKFNLYDVLKLSQGHICWWDEVLCKSIQNQWNQHNFLKFPSTKHSVTRTHKPLHALSDYITTPIAKYSQVYLPVVYGMVDLINLILKKWVYVHVHLTSRTVEWNGWNPAFDW